MKTLKKVLAIVLTLCSLTAMLTVGAWAAGRIEVPAISGTDTVTAVVYPDTGKEIYSSHWSLGPEASGKLELTDHDNYVSSADAYIRSLTNEAGTYSVKCTLEYTDSTTEDIIGSVTVSAAAIPVTGVTIVDPTGSSTMYPGTTRQLSVNIVPSAATNKNVTWESTDTTVLLVDGNGTVNAVKAGNASIIARSVSDPAVFGQYAITVSSIPVASVTVAPATADIMVGGTVTLSASVLPANAGNTNVIWGSSNNAVATVNNGVVTGVSAGTVTITAAAADGSGHSASCTVTVSAPILVNSIALSKTSTELAVGSSETLTVAVAPTNASNKTVNWSSNNTAVAAVDNGTVKAVSAGTAVITASAADGSGVSASCTVTVKASAANTFTISETAVNLTAGSTKQLYTRLDSADVTAGTSWSSTNTNVATVVNGKVTAKSAGTATISAIFDVGGTRYTAYSTVTVTGYAVQHQITYGNYSTFDGKNPLYFMTNDLASNFKGVAVDGYTLTNGNQYYATSSPDGHILVALNPAYLKMLSSASAHTIQIGSANGIAQGYFKLYGTSYNIYGVKTGDESNPGLWAALCFMAFLGAAAIVAKRRRDILG